MSDNELRGILERAWHRTMARAELELGEPPEGWTEAEDREVRPAIALRVLKQLRERST